MARIPTAANVSSAPSPRDPGVSVPNVGAPLARGMQDAGRDISALAERRRSVSEAVDRTLTEAKAREMAFQSLNDWKSSGDVAEEDSVSGYVRSVEQEFSGLLEGHKGGPESKARLQARLEQIRLDTIFKASTESTLARREILLNDIQRRQAETIGVVFQNPGALDDVLTDYEDTVAGLSDALGDRVALQVRQQGRETFVKSAVDGAIARGDLATVDAFLSDRSPYRQFLSPQASTTYRAQLASARNKSAKLTAAQSNILFAEKLGLSLTEEQKAAMLGAPVTTAERTPGEKAVAAAERAGLTLTREQRAAMLGVPDEDDDRTPGEKAVAAAQRAGLTLTREQRAAMLGVPDEDDDRTPGEKAVAAVERAGIPLSDDERKRMLGAPEAPEPTEFEEAVSALARARGTTPDALPPEAVQSVWDVVYGGSSGPFEGKGLTAQMFNKVIEGVDEYAAGGLTPAEEFTFEASVVALASDRTNPNTGEVTRGSLPVPVLRALEARGKRYDPAQNVILSVENEPPAAAAAAGSVPRLLDPNSRGAGTGPLNGAPPTAADGPPPAAPGASLTDAQLLEKVAAYARGDSDDPSAIAQANLFARADDIAGPEASIDASLYGIPLVGSLLTSPDTTQAKLWGDLLGRSLARARQQSPRFAVTEFEGLRKEITLSGSAWDNPERYRTGLVTIDKFLQSIEEQGKAFVSSGDAPKAEKQRIATVLNDVKFIREGLGVKQLPHPANRAEVEQLPPGTVFIYGGQHHTVRHNPGNTPGAR